MQSIRFITFRFKLAFDNTNGVNTSDAAEFESTQVSQELEIEYSLVYDFGYDPVVECSSSEPTGD
ncbi:hypothetical protein HK096_009084, partial [Nowakowskiella sp. JEL0078]